MDDDPDEAGEAEDEEPGSGEGDGDATTTGCGRGARVAVANVEGAGEEEGEASTALDVGATTAVDKARREPAHEKNSDNAWTLNSKKHKEQRRSEENTQNQNSAY